MGVDRDQHPRDVDAHLDVVPETDAQKRRRKEQLDAGKEAIDSCVVAIHQSRKAGDVLVLQAPLDERGIEHERRHDARAHDRDSQRATLREADNGKAGERRSDRTT